MARTLLLSLALALLSFTWAIGQETPAAADAKRGLQLEDPLQPFVPKKQRTEAEEDRLHAAALFAAGRMHEQKGEDEAALRRYQRAYRYDDHGMAILREIVPLAFSTGHAQEAIRYALIAAEKDPTDPALMRRLALYLAEQGQWERALKLYELVLEQIEEDENTADSAQIHLELGRLYFLNEQLDKAAQAFAVVDAALANPQQFGLDDETRAALLGEPELTYQLFAESYLAAGKLDEAEKAFRKSHEAKPDDSQLALNLARVEAQRGRTAEALNLLRDYFRDQPESESMQPYELFVELLTDLNQQATINDQLEVLRTAAPDDRILGYFLARRYLDAEKFDKAEPLLRELAAQQGDEPLVEVFQAQIELYRATEQMPQLLAALGRAVASAETLQPFDKPIQPLLEDEPRLEQLFALARERRAREPKPPAGEALAVAQLAIQAEQYDVAAEFFPYALEDESDRKAEILLTWGLELFLADQHEAAVRVFQRAVEEKTLAEDNPTFYYYLAGALEMAGKTDEALIAARKAAKLQPDAPEYASRVAWINYHADRLDAARQQYLDLLDEFDDQHESEDVRDVMRETRLVLSNIDVLRGDYESAEEWLEQVLDEYPEDIGAMNDLGYLWADQNKRLQRARRMIERAVADQPDNKAFLDSLGWVLYRQGEYEKAVETLERAAAGDDPDGVILDHLGDAYQKAGQRQKALDAWRRAQRAFRTADQADEAAAVQKKIKASQDEAPQQK